jgi:hypothetical protein
MCCLAWRLFFIGMATQTLVWYRQPFMRGIGRLISTPDHSEVG